MNGPTDGVYTCNVDGTGTRLLARGGRRPKWSPDGESIAYEDEGTGIWTMNPRGGEKQLVFAHPWTRLGSWAPTGHRYLAITLVLPSGRRGIYLADTRGNFYRVGAIEGEDPQWIAE